MYKKILDLLSEHSVALAILIANIVAAIIISRAASKDKILQNKYKETKETLHLALQILQQLNLVQNSNLTEFKELSSALILNCKKTIHLIAKSEKIYPQTIEKCKDLHDFLSTTDTEEENLNQVKKKTYEFYHQLNQAIQTEWLQYS